MADQPNTQPTPVAGGIPRVRDPQFRETYANASFVGIGPFDLTLTFSKTSDFTGQPMQVDQVSVTMSPQHFKGFCRSLIETLKAYEKLFGDLKIPDTDTRPTRDAAQIEELIKVARSGGTVLPAPKAESSSTEKKLPSRRSRGGAQK